MIFGNTAQYGGGIYCYYDSTLIINSIFWADTSEFGNDEICFVGASPTFSYCDIQGGWEGEGNIDNDPLFRDPANGDFHLMSTACGDSLDSPCIDSGNPALTDLLLDCLWGLGAERSDIGAYGGGDSLIVDVDQRGLEIPHQVLISKNYPNPFNAATIILYDLPQAANVRLEIYDILGRKIETMVSGRQVAGPHSITWDAREVPSGVYFYKIEADQSTETRKMVLAK